VKLSKKEQQLMVTKMLGQMISLHAYNLLAGCNAMQWLQKIQRI